MHCLTHPHTLIMLQRPSAEKECAGRRARIMSANWRNKRSHHEHIKAPSALSLHTKWGPSPNLFPNGGCLLRRQKSQYTTLHSVSRHQHKPHHTHPAQQRQAPAQATHTDHAQTFSSTAERVQVKSATKHHDLGGENRAKPATPQAGTKLLVAIL